MLWRLEALGNDPNIARWDFILSDDFIPLKESRSVSGVFMDNVGRLSKDILDINSTNRKLAIFLSFYEVERKTRLEYRRNNRSWGDSCD